MVDDGQDKELEHDVGVLLYQACRELLVNVSKHANADCVEVRWRRQGDQAVLSVADNGVGFDTSGARLAPDRRHGFGLFNIRERVQHIGGHFEVRATPGEGSQSTLRVPLSTDVGDAIV